MGDCIPAGGSYSLTFKIAENKNAIRLGLSVSSALEFKNCVGAVENSVCLRHSGAVKIHNDKTLKTVNGFKPGDFVRIRVDRDTGSFWARINDEEEQLLAEAPFLKSPQLYFIAYVSTAEVRVI